MAKKEKKIVETRKLRKFGMSTVGKIDIEWIKRNDLSNCDDEFARSSVEEPVESLKTAWENLVPVARSMAEIPDDWELTIRSMTVSYKKDKRMFTLTMMRKLKDDDKPLNITAPCKLQEEFKDFGCMDLEHVDLIDKFIAHVWEYVDGHRAQPDLPVVEGGAVEQKLL